MIDVSVSAESKNTISEPSTQEADVNTTLTVHYHCYE